MSAHMDYLGNMGTGIGYLVYVHSIPRYSVWVSSVGSTEVSTAMHHEFRRVYFPRIHHATWAFVDQESLVQPHVNVATDHSHYIHRYFLHRITVYCIPRVDQLLRKNSRGVDDGA